MKEISENQKEHIYIDSKQGSLKPKKYWASKKSNKKPYKAKLPTLIDNPEFQYFLEICKKENLSKRKNLIDSIKNCNILIYNYIHSTNMYISGISSSKNKKEYKSIGEWVRCEREKQCLSQSQLSKISNFSQSAIAEIELGHSKPIKKNAILLSTALKIDTKLFFIQLRKEYIEDYIKKIEDIFRDTILLSSEKTTQEITCKTIAELIIFERKKMNFTLRNMEDKTGISRTTICNIEKNIKPSIVDSHKLYHSLLSEYNVFQYIDLLLDMYIKDINSLFSFDN